MGGEETEHEIELASVDEDEEAFELVPEDELEVQKMRAEELLGQLQRVQADFDNYRKRMDARFQEAAKYASESILLKVLEIYDNLERALQVDFEKDPKGAREGIAAIKMQMETLLRNEGVRPMDPLGKPFDPYYQHSVHKINDPEKPDGVVVEVYQQGYMLREKVLRPALVVVNRHEAPAEEEEQESKEKGSEEDGE
ncbi:MAG: nucleotide exchange factor GrpE [Candidatus Thorarchaeota archaeon]|nr:MAG: nucleotide exchange factor GrpE [Candidatus Thorarchaeota archaeon]